MILMANFRVLNTILRLLKGHYAKALEVSVLQDLRSFLQEVKTPLAVVLATESIKLIDELVRYSLCLIMHKHLSSVAQIDSEDG